MMVCRVGVEVLDALVLDLAGIGHTHGYHVTVLVKQRVQLIALHG